ncbi:25425_t:CDS:2, partial [Racocetra persica]
AIQNIISILAKKYQLHNNNLTNEELQQCILEMVLAGTDNTSNETRPIIDAKTKQDIAQQPVNNEILNMLPRKKVVLSGLPVLEDMLKHFVKAMKEIIRYKRNTLNITDRKVDCEDWNSFLENFKKTTNELNIEFNIINILDINQRYSM